MTHKPVLLNEVLDLLKIEADDIVLDCTVGSGGHGEEICLRLGENGRYIGIDADKDALDVAEQKLKRIYSNIDLYEGNYRNFERVLDELGIGEIDKIIIDLGLRMDQITDSGRGFSFMKDEPLIMTFKRSPEENDLTAYEIVNDWNETSLNDIIGSYGEERYSKRIAKAIVEAREIKPIETTFELIEIIKSAVPEMYKRKKIHPATKTFQALRITVNDEIESLREGLARGFNRVSSGGKIAVISFHSIEDRIVKRFFKEKGVRKEGRLINKKPVTPDEDEIEKNIASRSAKLRVIEKI